MKKRRCGRKRLIYDGKRGFAVGKDTLKSLMSQIASDGRPSGKTGHPLKVLFDHSEPDIEKLPSKMPRKRTNQNLGEKASITLKGS